MAILRSDQSQLTFAAEGAQGGDPELNQGTRETSSPFVNDLEVAANAGDTSINVGANTNIVGKEGKHVRIGGITGTTGADVGSTAILEYEIRRVEFTSGSGTSTILYLDRPLAFYHAAGAQVAEVNATNTTDEHLYITNVPGVYESVSVPDMVPSIEPRYYLGTAAKRQAAEFYAGQQTYSGSLGGMVLLDAGPLRFPIGKMVTDPSAYLGTSDHVSDFETAGKKGDVFVNLQNATNLDVGSYLHCTDETSIVGGSLTVPITSGTNREVIRIKAKSAATGTSTMVQLYTPLRFDHLVDTNIIEVAASPYYTHTITPQNDLDTLSWHLHMRDSTETSANDFDRRYYGGMVDSASIAGEEGGLLTFGWDTVNFMGMVHNQTDQAIGGSGTGIGTNLYSGDSAGAGMPKYAAMNSITSTDVDFPSNNPYYFSQGVVKLFGSEIARIRNFSITINNATEPRYYISGRYDRNRGPSEIREGRKSYNMSCTLALPDSVASTATTYTGATGALEVFKQLILEGNYGEAAGARGFNVQIVFTRGTNDTITIDIPGDGTANTGINAQGAFITSAPHNVSGDGSALQVDVDMIFRDLQITVVDSQGTYS